MYKIGIAILMVIALSCHHDQDELSNQHDPSEELADETLQATLFTGQTEFFIIYSPLVTGEESLFEVHLTDLETYKPRPSGRLTIEMEGTTVSSTQPVEPGIFEVTMVPGEAGRHSITYTFQSDQGNESVSDNVEILASSGVHDHPVTEVGEVSLSKEKIWSDGVIVRTIQPVPFASVIPTSGEILAAPGKKKNVVAQGSGMVSFTDKDLVQGSSVSAGQLLFTISNEAMIEDNLRLQYEEARNQFEKSRSEYLRHRQLFREGAISERQYILTRTDYNSDSLRFSNLSDHLSENGLKVHAPITGTIHELKVSDGQYIETGQIMGIISSNQELLIRADLPQQFFGELDHVVSATFRPAYSDHVFTIEEVSGRLLARGSSVAENDHYLPVIFKVRNNGNLLEGAYTEVYLKSSVRKDALVVPLSAILEEYGIHYVYIQVTGESFSRRPVITGSNDGRDVEILEGLVPGERVVTQGATAVKAASYSGVVSAHEHEH